MEKEKFTDTLLRDFVFLDHRLENHPKLRTSVWWQQEHELVLQYCTKSIQDFGSRLSIKLPADFTGPVLGTRTHSYGEAPDQARPFTLIWSTLWVSLAHQSFRSYLAVPLVDGRSPLGLLHFDSTEVSHFQLKHLGLARLLAALVMYSHTHLESTLRLITPSSVTLGKVLKQVRGEVCLSQAELANMIKQSRIALSRWESGTQLPSKGPLYTWCRALGLLSSNNAPLVSVVDVTVNLLKILKEDPRRICELTPSQFEQFVAERLDRMGFDVTLTGATTHKDGGIDLIAVPKVRTVGAFLLAGQVKHHRGSQKTGRSAVDRLLAWKDSQFRLGLLVTNTDFTKDARWVAINGGNRSFLRLRNFGDLKRWIEDNFSSEENWREIPDQIILAPDVTISIPRPKVANFPYIWPLQDPEVSDI